MEDDTPGQARERRERQAQRAREEAQYLAAASPAVPAEELVWAPRWRTGIDYHELAEIFVKTTCGRSAMSATSITLTREAAVSHGMKPCPRCWPIQEETRS